MEPLTRVMALWFPDWPVTAARTVQGLPPRSPVAIISGGVVVACSDEARAQGVRRGIRVREAQLRCPELTVQAHDPDVDARAFDPIVTLIEEVIPGVQAVRPGLCLMRARGAARFYRGEEPAAAAVREQLQHRGHPTPLTGVADGRYTAEQAALHAHGTGQHTVVVPPGASATFLAPLPIENIDTPELAPLLRRLGARTLGDFAALDPADVRARFGEDGAAAHERAAGHDRRRIVPRVPPREFDVTLDLEPPLDRVDQLAFALRASADRFVTEITRAQLVCTSLTVTIVSDRGERSTRDWNHPAHFTASDVVDRVRWQLQGSEVSQVPLAAPVGRVTLSPAVVDAIGAHEEGLWGRRADDRIHHGLSRIQSMLGHDAVLTAVPAGGRLLAERRVLVPWGDAPPPRDRLAADRPWPGGLPPPAPATVYDPPPPATVLDAQHTPVGVDRRGRISAAPAWFTPGQGNADRDASGPARDSHGSAGHGRTHHDSARHDSAERGRPRRVTAWAGPWPVQQRWWDPVRTRQLHRLQLVDETGDGWLVLLEQQKWRVEARYD